MDEVRRAQLLEAVNTCATLAVRVAHVELRIGAGGIQQLAYLLQVRRPGRRDWEEVFIPHGATLAWVPGQDGPGDTVVVHGGEP